MKPLQIDCNNPQWQEFVRKSLEQGMEADLLNYQRNTGREFCSALARAHTMTLLVDRRNDAAYFRKNFVR